MITEEAKKLLFLDIETVSQYPSYSQLPDNWKALWKKQAISSYSDSGAIAKMKAEKEWGDAQYSALYTKKAALHPEFNKIICISVGYFAVEGVAVNLRVKTLYGEEATILNSLIKILGKFPLLASHNGKKFDWPVLAKRMIINGIALPDQLKLLAYAKPWEIDHLDTQDLWKFGDTSYPSLEMLVTVLNIEGIEWDIDPSELHNLYYSDENTEENAAIIKKYCAQDVVAAAQVYLKRIEPNVTLGNVVHV